MCPCIIEFIKQVGWKRDEMQDFAEPFIAFFAMS